MLLADGPILGQPTSAVAVVVAFILGIVACDGLEVRTRSARVSVADAVIAPMTVALVPGAMLLVLGCSTAIFACVWPSRLDARSAILRLGVRGVGLGGALAVSQFAVWLGRPSLSALLAPVGYLVFELVLRRLTAGSSASLVVTSDTAASQLPSALVFTCLLSVALLLVVTLPAMGVWGFLPVMALLVLASQSFFLLSEVQENYETTLAVLVEAAESGDARLKGHALRTLANARTIGRAVGVRGSELTALSYAALLHDVGGLRSECTGSESGADGLGALRMLSEVRFLDDAVSILRAVRSSAVDCANAHERLLTLAYIVALADDVDRARHPHVHAAHGRPSTGEMEARTPPAVKATVVAAALRSGLGVPAIS